MEKTTYLKYWDLIDGGAVFKKVPGDQRAKQVLLHPPSSRRIGHDDNADRWHVLSPGENVG